MFLCIYVSTYLCIYVSIHLCIYPSINLSIHQSIHPSIHQSIHPSIYPSINLSIHQSIHSSIYPFINLSIHQSIHPSIYLSVYLRVSKCNSLILWISARLHFCNSIFRNQTQWRKFFNHTENNKATKKQKPANVLQLKWLNILGSSNTTIGAALLIAVRLPLYNCWARAVAMQTTKLPYRNEGAAPLDVDFTSSTKTRRAALWDCAVPPEMD
jgi:hypothetical protein